jgi:hypothetical protein
MVISPAAIVAMVVGGAKIVRRVELSPSALRFEAALARAACRAMVAFLAGSACWLIDGGSGPRDLYHAGAIDLVGVGVMAIAVSIARSLSREVRHSLTNIST